MTFGVVNGNTTDVLSLWSDHQCISSLLIVVRRHLSAVAAYIYQLLSLFHQASWILMVDGQHVPPTSNRARLFFFQMATLPIKSYSLRLLLCLAALSSFPLRSLASLYMSRCLKWKLLLPTYCCSCVRNKVIRFRGQMSRSIRSILKGMICL